MNYMVAGLILFFGPHLVSTIPAIKATKISLMGEKAYKGMFVLLSLAGLILMGYGKSEMIFGHVYNPINEMRHAMGLVMWISFFLLAAAHMPSNIKRFTRHPMLWGITLWSVGHLMVNGDKGSIMLFGSFLIYSLWAMFSANIRGEKKSSKKVPIKKDIAIAGMSLVLTVIVMLSHRFLFGIAVI